jgi:Protein of unknwon function (DUF3310)
MNQVIHPKHYQSCAEDTRGIVTLLGIPPQWHDTECIQVIEQLAHIRQDYHVNHAIEYLWRVGQKEDAVQDLEKAKVYLQRRSQLFPTGKERDDKAVAMIDGLIEKYCS